MFTCSASTLDEEVGAAKLSCGLTEPCVYSLCLYVAEQQLPGGSRRGTEIVLIPFGKHRTFICSQTWDQFPLVNPQSPRKVPHGL